MAKTTHWASNGQFQKHSRYLAEVLKQHGINPFGRTLTDPVMGHTNLAGAPQSGAERIADRDRKKKG